VSASVEQVGIASVQVRRAGYPQASDMAWWAAAPPPSWTGSTFKCSDLASSVTTGPEQAQSRSWSEPPSHHGQGQELCCRPAMWV